MKKKWTGITAAALALSLVSVNSASAEENDTQAFKKMLTETGIEKGIPPEVLKAIAYKENGGFNHYNEEGQPVVSDDGGIGLMQLTFTADEIERYNIDMDRIANDVDYHIEQAADHLLRKKALNLPIVNDGEMRDLESWYFAVMAYNGLSQINDPNTNDDAYQEDVYDYIRNNSVIPVGETPELEINFGDTEEDRLIMSFPDRDYTWPTETPSMQLAANGSSVYTFHEHEGFDTSNVRSEVGGEVIASLNHYTPLEITAGPFEAAGEANHYVFYKVKGNFGEGYIASSNLQYGNDLTIFSDLSPGEFETAVAYLQQRDVINGYEDGTYKPFNVLQRRHAAALIVRALDLEMPEDYEVTSPDLTPETPGYQDLAIMEYHGIMGRGGQMNAQAPLNRSQMASMLNRSFEAVYEVPEEDLKIKDIGTDDLIYDDIAVIVHNGITNADENTAFNPWNSVTRGQYALFFERSIRLMEEKFE
ncbi:hypothetical protein KP77_28690 [Jeotgalibacillus alimentarius]|uniref:SLH domain-containing protein n=1 Tax=Jeotgalibacillus alimentarius TaxID=135826 RepID=A0A0C2VKY7_9BACL|nr:S-layer homology domain-containing protein [Jeotgalibacillus alimentarius]KIL44648.1 hypothetical protein KP77_28690 [Jeotgalibacillus alimentarius]